MKKSLSVLLIILTVSWTLQAQTKTGQALIDSLTIELPKAREDTAKINLLNLLGRSYTRTGEMEKGMEVCTQALSLAEKTNFKKGIANARGILGWIQIRQGSYYEALKHLDITLEIREELNDQNGIAAVCNTLGIVYEGLELYPDALKMYYRALKIYEAAYNKAGMRDIYNNIAIIYILMERYPEALTNLNTALKICEEIGDRLSMNHPYNNIGHIYYELGNYPEALKNFEASYKLRLEMFDKYEIGNILSSIGLTLTKQGKYSEAKEKLEESFVLANEVGNTEGISSYYLNMGELYFAMKNYDASREIFQKAIDYNMAIGSKEDFKLIYGSLACVDSATANYEGAYINHKRYILYKDSLINEENERQIVQQQMQYDFEKREVATKIEQEIRDATALEELQRQKLVRNGFGIGTILLLLLAGAIFMGLLKTRKAKKISEELLLNILPAEVANEIKSTGSAKAKAYTMVTVMFTDFKDFTKVSEKVSAELLVAEIDTCFSAFDHLLSKYKIEKIKTIGDAYLCVSGLPVSNYTHAVDMLNYAVEIRNYMLQRKKDKEAKGEIPFEVRIGIHTGPLVAGIVGVKKYAYDIWGDTVNLAARMEQNSESGKVNISGSTYELVKDKFKCVYRGKIQAKNKGEVDMYFVDYGDGVFV